MLSHFSRVWLFVTPDIVTCCSLGSSVHGTFRQEYWNGLPCSPPGDLPSPGIESLSLMSPELAGRIFTASATWESPTPLPHHGESIPWNKLSLFSSIWFCFPEELMQIWYFLTPCNGVNDQIKRTHAWNRGLGDSEVDAHWVFSCIMCDRIWVKLWVCCVSTPGPLGAQHFSLHPRTPNLDGFQWGHWVWYCASKQEVGTWYEMEQSVHPFLPLPPHLGVT